MPTRTIAEGSVRATGAGLVLTATAKLHQLDGNERPYFSLTGELSRSSRDEPIMCGAMGETLVKVFPALAPVELVHLSDDRGQPMHAEANALYWAGFASDGSKDVWRQMSPRDQYGRIPIETDAEGLEWSPAMLAEHLQLSEAEAREIRRYVAEDPSQHYSAAMHFQCQMLRRRWEEQAAEALRVIHNMPGDRRNVKSLATL